MYYFDRRLNKKLFNVTLKQQFICFKLIGRVPKPKPLGARPTTQRPPPTLKLRTYCAYIVNE